MDIFSKYLYFFSSLTLLFLFFVIFYLRRDLRSRMLIVGLIVGIFGIFSEIFFFKDYWNPPLIFRFGEFGGIEDFLFGFAFGGIGTSIYDFVLHKRFRKKRHPHYWIIPVLGISELASLFVFFDFMKINSIYASAVGLLIPMFIIIIIRKDLIIETIISAIITAFLLVFLESLFLSFAPDYLRSYYFLYGKVPLIFGYAPITELIWGLSFGSIIGPIYDFYYGNSPVSYAKLKIRKNKAPLLKRKKLY